MFDGCGNIISEQQVLYEEVYMKIPKGCEEKSRTADPKASRLNTLSYGLWHAARQWHKILDEEIIKFVFKM
jgi:hypothetical protein